MDSQKYQAFVSSKGDSYGFPFFKFVILRNQSSKSQEQLDDVPFFVEKALAKAGFNYNDPKQIGNYYINIGNERITGIIQFPKLLFYVLQSKVILRSCVYSKLKLQRNIFMCLCVST